MPEARAPRRELATVAVAATAFATSILVGCGDRESGAPLRVRSSCRLQNGAHAGNGALFPPGGGEVYLVSLFTLAEGVSQADLGDHVGDIRELLGSNGAEYVMDPIEAVGEIRNPALPATAVAFPGDWITIAVFPDRRALDVYCAQAEVNEAQAQWGTRLASEIRFVAQAEPILPGFPLFPVLGSVPFRPEPPAFLLINAIATGTDPETLERLNRFFGGAAPTVLGAGTMLFAPFGKVTDLVGHYGFDILFFTEWTDLASFEAVHSNPAFLEVAREYRNTSLTSFTDYQGRLALELGDAETRAR